MSVTFDCRVQHYVMGMLCFNAMIDIDVYIVCMSVSVLCHCNISPQCNDAD